MLVVLCALVFCIDSVAADIVIINGEGEEGHSNCARVCSGTTGRTSTNWIDYSGSTGVYTDVDITKCGFVLTPTITTSIEGSSTHWEITGTSAVYNASPSKFRIYLAANRRNTRKSIAKIYKWNVEWIAVGYTCRKGFLP